VIQSEPKSGGGLGAGVSYALDFTKIYCGGKKGAAGNNRRNRRDCIGVCTGCIRFLCAIGMSLPWELSSGVDLFEQPGHVLAEGLHGSEALLVSLDFALGPADADVPVAGAWDDHLSSVAELGHEQERSVVREAPAAGEQRIATAPEDLGRLIQAALADLSLQVRPAGLATVADIVLPVIPPELEPAEGLAILVFHTQNAVAVQKSFDLPSIVHGDPLHGRTSMTNELTSGFTCTRHIGLCESRRCLVLFTGESDSRFPSSFAGRLTAVFPPIQMT